MSAALDQGPGEYFKPNSQAQTKFFLSEAPEILISSAYGKGKSRILCEKAYYLCAAFPGAEVVLARKQRASMGATTLRTLLSEVAHPAIVADGWRPAADGGSTLFFPNGSSILCVGLDKPSRARSGSFTAAYVDQAEELEEEEWDAIGGRLRNPHGPYRQLGGACNPEGPNHFLFKRFNPQRGSHVGTSDREEKLPGGRKVPPGRVIYETIVSGPEDNYENLGDDYHLRLGRYKGRYRARYVEGKWVEFEGLIYDVWNPQIHIIDTPATWVANWGGYPPPDWPRYRGFDFGYVNPFSCQWWVRTPSDRWILYREIYMTNRTVAAHSRTVLQEEEKELQTLRRCLADQAARDRRKPDKLESLYISMSVADHDAEDIATLHAAGISADRAVKDVTPGIETLYQLMQPGPDGEPMIAVLRNTLVEKDHRLEADQEPTCFADEVGGYQYEQAKEGKPAKEAPRKFRDHACDTARYVLHTAMLSGSVKFVWL